MAAQSSALSLCCLQLPAWLVQVQQLSKSLLHSCYRTQEALTVKDKTLAQDTLILSPTRSAPTTRSTFEHQDSSPATTKHVTKSSDPKAAASHRLPFLQHQ